MARVFYVRSIYLGSTTLDEILQLHKEGMSSEKLGKMYKKDHTTILYWIKKVSTPEGMEKHLQAKLLPKPPTRDTTKLVTKLTNDPQIKAPAPAPPGKYDHLMIEDINPGMGYKDYLIKKHGKIKTTRILRSHRQ